MSAKAIATEKMTIEVMTPVNGTVKVTSNPSPVVKAGGNGIYYGELKFAVSSIEKAGFKYASLTGCTIKPSATDTKIDDDPVIRQDDSADFTVTGTNESGATSPIDFKVKITDAGQSDVKGS